MKRRIEQGNIQHGCCRGLVSCIFCAIVVAVMVVLFLAYTIVVVVMAVISQVCHMVTAVADWLADMTSWLMMAAAMAACDLFFWVV